jgi:hypothetical protein
MFTINKGIICNIINKAREINISDSLSLPDDQENLSEVEWMQILAEYQDDLSYLELKDLLNELEPDQQQDIMALMFIGRGDFGIDEWKEARRQTLAIKRVNRADYLISKTLLADYLTEGLAAFGYSCDE